MSLVFLNETFCIDPNEVSALEKFEKWDSDSSPSGASWLDHTGTIVVQKNGRKTYLRDITPEDCHDLLFPKDIDATERRLHKMLPPVSDKETLFRND